MTEHATLSAEELTKKINTSGGFDSEWFRQEMLNWDIKLQQRKADFQEHMYQCYQPSNHCFTGLWERFCLTEAGPYCRDLHFERLQFIKDLEEGKIPADAMVPVESMPLVD